MLGRERYDEEGKLENPLAATQMGLIYVNPEGPGGNPDPLAAAEQIRASFGRMAMNDEETVALIAGGHTFGKNHGAGKPSECVGPEPAAAAIEEQGLGWSNKCGKGNAEDTITSGLEGAWTAAPTQWTMLYLTNLFSHEWEQTRSPAGAIQWVPKGGAAADTVPDAHVEGKTARARHAHDGPVAEVRPGLSRDLQALPREPARVRARLRQGLVQADPPRHGAARPLCGRRRARGSADLAGPGTAGRPQTGRRKRYRRAQEEDPRLRPLHRRAGADRVGVGRHLPRYGHARWRQWLRAFALAPQKDWAVNDPAELAKVLQTMEGIQKDFNDSMSSGKKVSLADLIVLGGAAAIEQAAKEAGHEVEVPFTPGRADATQEQTDVESFAVLEPTADGFRNYFGSGNRLSPAEMLVDRADLLGLTVPEMTALVGGMRSLGANAGGVEHGVFTDRPGTLNNDFFVNLLDMATKWSKAKDADGIYEGRDAPRVN